LHRKGVRKSGNNSVSKRERGISLEAGGAQRGGRGDILDFLGRKNGKRRETYDREFCVVGGHVSGWGVVLWGALELSARKHRVK